MSKHFKVLLLFVFVIFYSCSKQVSKIKFSSIKIEAPFNMPAIKIPDFTACKKFNITVFGAKEGNINLTTKAISDAINEANKNNGGIVVIPKGEWLTKAIHLKSNVNLHLNKGAILLFSEAPKDYLPAVHSTWEGMECYNYSPLVYAYNCENIAITGEGLMKSKMDVWETWFPRPKPHMNSLKRLYNLASYNKPVEERQMVNDTAHFRPQFIQFNRSKHILLEGISIENSPFWTIHPYLSKDVVIRNLNVYAHGHNNDGVDPEMSENVLIENCVFDQGDDAIAIKSGRNQDAWRLNTPSKNIVMRNCIMKNGHQLVAIGSELSGGIENVYVENCTVENRAKMYHLVFIKTNERRGGYVKNIFVENIKAGNIANGVLGIETDVLYQWRDLVPTIERKLTPIENIHLTNIKTTKTQYISNIEGQKELPVKDIFLKQVIVDTLTKEKHIHSNVLNFKDY
ncbi:glycoside hydrolase family 28 protein [Aestuariibaculum sp. TT11]|uniref:Glycoside hydrolase family 28 protein n=1 Tax=Aestuariibaculum sediminum TaxID=2770637 RepID=A0A8J6Q250_9FLAO|nr:glycoside hydrolase family 28 protein [Aestuariibaculum sediminum]